MPNNQPSSGAIDEDSGCAISVESFDKITEYEAKPKPFRIAGLVLVLGGIVTGVVGLIRKPKGPEVTGPQHDGSPGPG